MLQFSISVQIVTVNSAMLLTLEHATISISVQIVTVNSAMLLTLEHATIFYLCTDCNCKFCYVVDT